MTAKPDQVRMGVAQGGTETHVVFIDTKWSERTDKLLKTPRLWCNHFLAIKVVEQSDIEDVTCRRCRQMWADQQARDSRWKKKGAA